MPNSALYRDAARKKLKSGVQKLSDAVCSTLGPRGKNVIIETNGEPHVTKDGVTVARYFECEDPVENLGVKIIRQASSKTNSKVGDGTTTSTLLALEIINACEKEIESSDRNVHDLSREMKEYSAKVSDYLSTLAVEVDEEKLVQVATISANNDEKIGRLVGELVHKIGKDGVVSVEEGSSTDIETSRAEGFQIPCGFASPFMLNNQKGECVLNDVPVLVTDKNLSSFSDAKKIIETAASLGVSKLVVLADEIGGDALVTFVANKVNALQAGRVPFETLCVKLPGYGTNKVESAKDAATMLGATFVSAETGVTLEGLTVSHFGKASKVISDKDKTTLMGGSGNPVDIEARVKELRELVEKEENQYDKNILSERLARMTGGIAVIKVGAPTEVEMREKKYLVEDAVCATKAAKEAGVLAGGGSALLHASLNVEPCFISECLSAPFKAIAENAGSKEACSKVKKMLSKHPNAGYDAKTDTFENDMVKKGIVDPLKVVQNTLQNAVSVASIYLTTDCVLYTKKDEFPQVPKKQVSRF